MQHKPNGVYTLWMGDENTGSGVKFFGVKMLPLRRRDTGLILSHGLCYPREFFGDLEKS